AAARAKAEADLAIAQQKLQAAEAKLRSAEARANTTAQDSATVEARLLAALDSLERAQAAATDRDLLRSRLMAALAEKQQAETGAAEQMDLAEQRAQLLAQARASLADQKEISAKAQRDTALLNQQVAALRDQLGQLQALLDDAQTRDSAAKVQIQSLGSDLNAALARAASEERKRRLLEEAERKRLEEERAKLAAEAEALRGQTQDLEKYRSDFFGRLRDLLGNQEGVRIEGDRFVFSSEVLFAPASADLSPDGQQEIAKVARILQSIAASIPPEINWVIRVDGHTDNTPLGGFGKYTDNWELSQGRALSVVKYMVNALGIPPDRLAANGFGEYQPINTADTPEARAQNRRIELKLNEK
ncbi:MAG: peptidoglycan -binding protein, partial [Pseudomonadota bacterium]|nr:peptidoglycan -binding protein [Pseudomonadota bacterium]